MLIVETKEFESELEAYIVVEDSSVKEGDGLNDCDMCEYKCKKVKTVEKHLNTKHENYLTCEICEGKNFINDISHKSERCHS